MYDGIKWLFASYRRRSILVVEGEEPETPEELRCRVSKSICGESLTGGRGEICLAKSGEPNFIKFACRKK